MIHYAHVLLLLFLIQRENLIVFKYLTNTKPHWHINKNNFSDNSFLYPIREKLFTFALKLARNIIQLIYWITQFFWFVGDVAFYLKTF